MESPNPPFVNNTQQTIIDRLGVFGLIVAVVSITMQIGGFLDNSKELANLQKENARLNTLVLNHTDKLDNDTIVAQQLLAAATTALSSCKK